MLARYKVSQSNRNINHYVAPIKTLYEHYWGNKNIDTNKMAQKTRNSRKRTSYRKNKKKGIVKRSIPRTLAPANKLVRCRASNYQTFTCTSGALSGVRIKGNDITDPFDTYGAGQPLGYDQWKALYRTAYVLGCRVKFTVWNNQTTALMFGVSMMDKNQGSTLLTDYEYYKEVPKTNSRMLSPDVDHGVIVNKQSTRRGLSIKDIIDNDTIRINLQADTGPNDNYYAHVWVQPVDQSTTLTTVQGVIDVEYIVLLTNPIVPTRSVA